MVPSQSRKDVEGGLFVVKRNAQPRFQFIVLNRQSPNNLTEDLLGGFEFELSDPYLLYRNKHEVNGIWFYQREECEAIAALLARIVATYQKPDVLPAGAADEPPAAAPAPQPAPTPPQDEDDMNESVMQLFQQAAISSQQQGRTPPPQHQQQPPQQATREPKRQPQAPGGGLLTPQFFAGGTPTPPSQPPMQPPSQQQQQQAPPQQQPAFTRERVQAALLKLAHNERFVAMVADALNSA